MNNITVTDTTGTTIGRIERVHTEYPWPEPKENHRA